MPKVTKPDIAFVIGVLDGYLKGLRRTQIANADPKYQKQIIETETVLNRLKMKLKGDK